MNHRTILFFSRSTLSALVLVLLVGLGLTGVRASASQQSPLPSIEDPTIPPELAQRIDAGLLEADKLRQARQYEAARARLEAIARDAQQAGARRHHAAALFALGRVQGLEGHRPAAKATLTQALALYRELGHRPGEATTVRSLGVQLYNLGEYPAARKAIEEAVAIYHELKDVSGLAIAYNNLVYMHDPGPEKDAIRQQALRYTREANDRPSECGVLHEWGDELFEQGDYIASRPRLLEALACYEGVKEPEDIGRVLVSLGRLQRAHGQFESALEYYTRALAIQEAGGARTGAIQSRNAMAVALMSLGRFDEALAHYERALAEARAQKAEPSIVFLIGQLGGYYLFLEQYEKAVTLLEASLQLNQKPPHLNARYNQLAKAYMGLGNLARAQEYAEKAMAGARDVGPEALINSLCARSDIARKRGDYAAADRDLRDAVSLIEDLRAKTLPVDFMKRGFGEINQVVYASTIELLMQRGHWRAALETAEQARARAFLDLLASRTQGGATTSGTGASAASSTPAAPTPAAATDARPAATDAPLSNNSSSAVPSAASSATASHDQATASSAQTPASSAEATTAAAPHEPTMASGVVLRGGTASPATAPAATTPAATSLAASAAVGLGPASTQLVLDSSRSAPPADIATMIATAKRLRSTLLAYWVGERESFAWVISPAGQVRATRIQTPAARLQELVVDASRAVSSTDGVGFAFMGRSQMRPWRELYSLLIHPVRAYLPTAPNSLLTIVPHGPLFRVSFAALQDERGRYLVERYRLHYTPAVAVLQFTAQPRRATPAGPRQALLIGDPGEVTPEPGGEPLPALPWARREVDEIAAEWPAGGSHVLVADRATEADVRAKLAGMDLIHFATHGVVRQQQALSSFLALRGAATGTDPARDGRLTAEEVYRLDLHAQLVVLSACGTALGPMSGDGVIGFTRAFLYAGAASVIATEWDVPDEAGYELMRRFYRERSPSSRDSEALRAAQLDVIRALRAGELKVTTAGRDIALPEHPLFWAGFVLVGEP